MQIDKTRKTKSSI